MSYAIEAENISKKFQGRLVLENLSFSWSPDSYCIYGKNGRGKSTLLRILCGSERNFSGSLRIMKEDALLSPESVNRFRSYLPDDPSFYPKSTTADLLSFVASVRNLDLRELTAHGLERFGLKELLHQPLERQSLGQRKRSFFGAVLLKQVSLWILDEPTNGLDDCYQKLFFEEVESHVRRGGTVVIATHDPSVSIKLNSKAFYLYPEATAQPVTALKHE